MRVPSTRLGAGADPPEAVVEHKLHGSGVAGTPSPASADLPYLCCHHLTPQQGIPGPSGPLHLPGQPSPLPAQGKSCSLQTSHAFPWPLTPTHKVDTLLLQSGRAVRKQVFAAVWVSWSRSSPVAGNDS